MSYPLFKWFQDAMNEEMRRHERLGDKGGDWTQPTQTVTIKGSLGDIRKEVETVAYLDEAFRAAVEEYFENPTQDQLVDVANLAGMLWTYGEGALE